jgi:hypothetical protein
MLKMPTLLPEEPSSVDDLGGAHAKIANTITTLVKASPGGVTIRLDGTWGAGKSTVVKMVAESLEQYASDERENEAVEQTDVAVFQYDAWVHAGDPLRRAFLNSLVNKCAARGWLRDGDGMASVAFWIKRLDHLSRRLKITSRKTTPFFSTSAKVFLSALIALGVATPMLSELEKKLILPLGIGPLMAATLAAGFVAFAIIHLLSNDAFGFIVRRNSDEEVVEVRDEPEPTSIEFQDAFGELMLTVLGRENRRLVIVVDNLDRIDQIEAKAVWSLLRSFLDNPQFKPCEWFARLWVLIPVADERRVLESSMPSTSPTAGTKEQGPSFLEKVFQLRFSLPPPMLHSWKNYFNAKLVQAFGEDLLGEYDEILRLYEDCNPASSLTPRAIVSFVNELVVLKIEWSEKVSLSNLAGYLLSKDRFGDGGYAPPDTVSRILRDDSLSDVFAMLYHRASTKEEASYLSVRPRLETALDNADSKTLAQLFSDSPGFEFVLDRYIRQDLSGLEQQQERLLQAVRAILPLTFIDDALDPPHSILTFRMTSYFRNTVLSTMAASGNLRLLNENLVLGLKALLDISESREHTASLIIDLLRNVSRSAAEQSAELSQQIAVGWTAWTTALEGILTIDEVHAHVSATDFEPIILPIDVALWAKLCSRFRHTGQHWILSSCACLGGDDAQVAWLQNQFDSEKVGDDMVALLKQAMETKREYFFDAVADSLVEKFGASDFDALFRSEGSPLESVIALFRVDRSRLKPILRKLANAGELFKALQTNRPTNDWRVAALIYLIVFATDGLMKVELTKPDGNSEAMQGLNVVTKMLEGKIGLNSKQGEIYAEVLRDLDIYETLPILATRWSGKGLADSIVPALAANKQFIHDIRARGDFKTELVAFANDYVVDAELRHAFVDAARVTESATDVEKPVGDLSTLADRLGVTQIPI